jgi:hypothetical protein
MSLLPLRESASDMYILPSALFIEPATNFSHLENHHHHHHHHHHQPLNAPTAGAQAFLMDYT